MMDALIAGAATDDGINGADWYLKFKHRLPDYYIKEEDALSNGWVPYLGNLHEVAPGQMLTKPFENRKGKLPNIPGRTWTEADINYIEGFRNDDRVIFSNDGLIFVTYDHYQTFIEIL